MTVARPEESGAAPESIEELFSSLESPLLAYALRLLGDRESAQDIVQESFMRLHAQFSEVREPRRWLYRTAHNLAINHLRQSSRVIPLEPIPADPSEDSPTFSHQPQSDPDSLPDAQIIRLEGIGLVHLSLATLDPRSREVVRLKFEEDLSYKEIAERTGLGTGHVFHSTGLLCVAGSGVTRLGAHAGLSTAQGTFDTPLDLSLPGTPFSAAPGLRLNAQLWYRDPLGATSTNLSSAVSLLFR